ncbi:hypothetical protein WMF31_36540 [Sorangium sp. So ce1036]
MVALSPPTVDAYLPPDDARAHVDGLGWSTIAKLFIAFVALAPLVHLAVAVIVQAVADLRCRDDGILACSPDAVLTNLDPCATDASAQRRRRGGVARLLRIVNAGALLLIDVAVAVVVDPVAALVPVRAGEIRA